MHMLKRDKKEEEDGKLKNKDQSILTGILCHNQW